MASSPSAAAPSKKTQTTFVTITSTLPADFPASSLSPRPQAPTAHDIVPTARSPPSSHYPSPSALSASFRHSTYPRPSPPGFLYPDPIVPRAAQNQLQHAHAHTDMATNNVIWPLAHGLEVLIFAAMCIGLTWAGRVFARTFPARTRGAKEEAGNERRPVDKPEEDSGRATRGRGDTAAREPVDESKQRCQSERRRGKCSAATGARCGISSSVGSEPQNSLLRTSSPTRYLSAPRQLQPRTSSEWLALHAGFFNATSSSSSLAPSLEYDQEYDIEALEAGTAPRSPSLEVHKKSLSWADLDLGLEKMEGAVSGWVGKVARWTDDEGDEGVLLPVVNGRQGIKAD